MTQYGPAEMIAFTGSRMLADNTLAFVATGLPMVAARFAQLTHAPNLNIIFEAGSLGAILDQGMPLSAGDTKAFRQALFAKGLCGAFELAQRGYADYAFIHCAQIDMYGNINSHFQGGSSDRPAVRLPGSGSAGSIAANCEKSIAIMTLEQCRFVEKLDFVTSIGYGDGTPDYRLRTGVLGSGPYRVITSQALFGFHEKSRRMMLLEVARGRSAEDIMYQVGFDLLISPNVKEMPEPDEENLLMLRQCDPDGYFLQRKVPK